jgi:hypothetical protein
LYLEPDSIGVGDGESYAVVSGVVSGPRRGIRSSGADFKLKVDFVFSGYGVSCFGRADKGAAKVPKLFKGLMSLGLLIIESVSPVAVTNLVRHPDPNQHVTVRKST